MPTRTQYRQQAAQEAGRYWSGTSDATASTAQLDDTALLSSLSINDLYVDYWLYIPGAGAEDQVRTVSLYTPSVSSTGRLTNDRAWSATSVPTSVAYELHGMFDPRDMHTYINDGLKRCFVEVEITVTPTAQATRHDLTTANTWLTKDSWVRQVGYLTTGETRANVDPYRGRVVRGYAEKLSNLVYMVTPNRTFSSSETIYVKCCKPAYFHCRASGGTFGDQSGLAAETDEAVPTVEWVAWAALAEASRRGFTSPNTEAQKLWSDREGRFAQLFNQARAEECHLPARTFRPVIYVGVGRYGRGR